MTKISVKNLSKKVQDQQILSNVSFNSNSGQITALLGGSGAGKSTLLRCLNLLTQPSGGHIVINQSKFNFGGNDKTNDKSLSEKQTRFLRAEVGMVFQQFNLWPHRTVLANLIEAPIQVLKKTKEEAIAEAKKLLHQVNLVNKENNYPHQLSGGEQQRVAIARALMMHPDIMLFDEPTSALDPRTILELVPIIKALAAKGMTMIIATHEMSFARRIADQIIFLDKGTIVEQGSTMDMFANPKTVEFKQFIEGSF